MTVERHSNGLLMIPFGFARVPCDTLSFCAVK
jgi:hypothetical protein